MLMYVLCSVHVSKHAWATLYGHKYMCVERYMHTALQEQPHPYRLWVGEHAVWRLLSAVMIEAVWNALGIAHLQRIRSQLEYRKLHLFISFSVHSLSKRFMQVVACIYIFVSEDKGEGISVVIFQHGVLWKKLLPGYYRATDTSCTCYFISVKFWRQLALFLV